MEHVDIQQLKAEIFELDLSGDQRKALEERIKKVEKALHLAEFKAQRSLKEKQSILSLIKKLSEDLEAKVSESERKSQDLERVNEQLRRAEETAKAASRAKSRFLANMSHEIRTPMNGVLGMLQMLEITRLDDEQQQYVEIIRKAGESLLSLIDQILDLSKIEAGKLDLELREFDLQHELYSLIELFQPNAKANGLELHFHWDERLPVWIQGDAHRLRQVLSNLLGNALKFTEKGSVSLRVEQQDRDEKTISIRFVVQDSGIGISPEQQRQLFSPFHQADSSITRKYGGTGLGLSISQHLISMMGGQIKLQSEYGAGSTFSFCLRFESGPNALSANASSPAKRQHFDVHLQEKIPLNLLLVEDNELNQIVAQAVCHKMGYQPDIANNGREAVEMAMRSPYDIILMDLQMPEMDGYEASRIIQAMRLHPIVPRIIAMTANVSPEEKEKCRQEGMDDFIGKPFSLADFQQMLVKWGVGEGVG